MTRGGGHDHVVRWTMPAGRWSDVRLANYLMTRGADAPVDAATVKAARMARWRIRNATRELSSRKHVAIAFPADEARLIEETLLAMADDLRAVDGVKITVERSAT